MACSSVKSGTDEWRRDLRRGLCASDGSRGVETYVRVEAYFDVRTEHDFTALARDTRNALDNPTSALDLLDLLFLFCRSILSSRDVF